MRRMVGSVVLVALVVASGPSSAEGISCAEAKSSNQCFIMATMKPKSFVLDCGDGKSLQVSGQSIDFNLEVISMGAVEKFVAGRVDSPSDISSLFSFISDARACSEDPACNKFIDQSDYAQSVKFAIFSNPADFKVYDLFPKFGGSKKRGPYGSPKGLFSDAIVLSNPTARAYVANVGEDEVIFMAQKGLEGSKWGLRQYGVSLIEGGRGCQR